MDSIEAFFDVNDFEDSVCDSEDLDDYDDGVSEV